jgi:hypothetical protein
MLSFAFRFCLLTGVAVLRYTLVFFVARHHEIAEGYQHRCHWLQKLHQVSVELLSMSDIWAYDRLTNAGR